MRRTVDTFEGSSTPLGPFLPATVHDFHETPWTSSAGQDGCTSNGENIGG